MEKIIIFFFFISISLLSYAQTHKNNAYKLFDSTEVVVKSAKYCRVDMHTKKYFDWEKETDFELEASLIAINNKAMKKSMVFLRPFQSEAILMDNKKMVIVDKDRKAFFQFAYSRSGSSEFVAWEDEIQMDVINMARCFAPWMNSFRNQVINTPERLWGVRDTIVSGIQYRVIHGKQKFPRQYNLTYLVNAKSHLIERLTKVLSDSLDAQKGWPTRVEISYKTSFEDHTAEIAQLFSPKNPNYADYEFTDNSGIEKCNEPMKMGDTLSASILDFPMQRLDGSWTTLREQKGYVLLDLFNNHCGPCVKFFKEQAAERDSLGKTRLEMNNIQVMSINTVSRNIDVTKTVVDGYVEDSHVMVAFGIEKYIMIPGYPMFILISPNKKILYITNKAEEHYLEKIINAKCKEK